MLSLDHMFNNARYLFSSIRFEEVPNNKDFTVTLLSSNDRGILFFPF